MRNVPDFESWVVFLRVAETGSFVRSADDLGISQSKVSKEVTCLEDRMGTQLLYRTSRNLSLTPAGKVLRDSARRLLDEAKSVEREVSSHAKVPRGVVRVSAPVSFGIRYLAPILPSFLSTYPDIQIDLVLTDICVDLVSEGFDIAIRSANLSDSTLRARRLCVVPQVLVGAPDCLNRYDLPSHPDDIAGIPKIVCVNSSFCGAWKFDSLMGVEAYVVPVDGCLRSNNIDVIIPALLAGQGISLLPEFMVRGELDGGRLQEVSWNWKAADVDMHFVTPPGMLRSACVSVVLDYFSENLNVSSEIRFDSPCDL